jgi:competence protein ComEA
MPEHSRSTIVVWVVAAVLAVAAGMRLLGGGDPPQQPVRVDAPVREERARQELYVHVTGAVRRPGLFRVRSDARVAKALERAGGPTRRADLTLVNLAARLQDGQQIVVPPRGGAPGATPAGPVRLSTATADQLDEIDGIGPTLAERIIEYRDEQGGLSSLEELAEVEGIGEQRLATLREALQP